MSTRNQIEAASQNLSTILEWVTRTDNRASIILGIDVGMVGVLFAFASVRSSVTSQSDFAAILTGVLAVILLGLSLAFIILAGYPRLKGPNDSLLYFGAIANRGVEEYRNSFLNMSEQDYLRNLLDQCHRNSVIVVRKFWCLKWSYRMLAIGIIPWVVSLFL